jgi:hypothetical protein
VSGLDLTTSSDVDWFYVQAPTGASGSFRVTMQSSQLSSVSPRIQVYNAALQLAGWASAGSNAYGSTVTLNFTGVTKGTGIFIAALGWNGASSGVNGIGAYGLQLDFTGGAQLPPIAPPNTTVGEQPDQGGGTINEETFEPGSSSELNAPSLAPSFEAIVSPAAFPWLDGNLAASDGSVALVMPDVSSSQTLRLFLGMASSNQFRGVLPMFDDALDEISRHDDNWADSPNRATLISWTRNLSKAGWSWRGKG